MGKKYDFICFHGQQLIKFIMQRIFPKCFSHISAIKIKKSYNQLRFSSFYHLFQYPEPGSNRHGSESTGV